MNYETLKASIQAVIKANGNEEITGPILQQTLLAIVNALGTGYQFLGIANSGTTLETPDQRVYYVAFAYGTSIEIGDFTIEDEICILKYDEEWTKAQIAAIDTEPTDGSDNLITSGGVAQGIESALALIENAYAKKEGVYPGIVAGSAQSLLNPVALAGSFLFRPTGDGAPIGKGRAVFSELRGKSLAWNQLVKNGNFADTSNWTSNNGAISVSGNIGKLTVANTGDSYLYQPNIPIINGHKYFISYDIKGSNTTSKGHLRLYGAYNELAYYLPASFENHSMVITANANATQMFLLLDEVTAGDTIEFKNISILDLTLMLGEGNEPATVADFEKMFPLPYYAYNAGKVIPFAAQDYETTGLNQWDEEVVAYGPTSIISANYIPVFPSTAYYFNIPNGMKYDVLFYDANKVQIGSTDTGDTAGVKTTRAGSAYIKFRINLTTPYGGNTYNHDICISLSGPRNGEYEPYKKTTLHLNPAGWVDPYDNNIFPYGGMHGVGSAYDFAKVDADGYIRKATRTFGRVNLGDLSWNKDTSGDNWAFYTDDLIGQIVGSSTVGVVTNNICARYTTIDVNTSYNKDKSLFVKTSGQTFIIDTAYTDAAAFKTAMDGVYLIFQLATPVESTLDDPVKAFTDVDGSGTEAWKPDNATDPYTTPCNVSIFYPLDIAGGVISAQSFANFCSELSTKLGAALNKTISIAATYNAATEQYGYTITIS